MFNNDTFDFSLLSNTAQITNRPFVSASSYAAHRLTGLNIVQNRAQFDGIDGSGYTVVVLDSGIDLDHPLFGPDRDGDGIADRIVFTADFTNEGDGTAQDTQGHGTHVSGIIGANHPIYGGVAPGVNLIHLQVLDGDGSGSFRWIQNALDWVIENSDTYNIVAVNLSLGDGSNLGASDGRSFISDEFAQLAEMGIISVASAGNDYGSFDPFQGVAQPAADPNVIAVGAVFDRALGQIRYGDGVTAYASAADRIAPFSQRDEGVIFAPGVAIASAGLGGGITTSSGTSQAAPYIAGLVALAQDLANEVLGRSLTAEEFTTLLFDTAKTIFDGDDEQDSVENTQADYARVNASALLSAILATAEEPASTIEEVMNPSISEVPGTDLPYSTRTDGYLAIGAPATGTIASSRDRDAFKVDLVAGNTYVFDLKGSATGDGSLADPMLFLFTPSVRRAAQDDDSGAGLNARIIYTATETGTYYVGADGWGSNTGSYVLNVEDYDPRPTLPATREDETLLLASSAIEQAILLNEAHNTDLMTDFFWA